MTYNGYMDKRVVVNKQRYLGANIMTYTCQQTIIDTLRASGPQTIGALRRECRQQATDYTPTMFLRALHTTPYVVRADDAEGIVYEILG